MIFLLMRILSNELKKISLDYFLFYTDASDDILFKRNYQLNQNNYKTSLQSYHYEKHCHHHGRIFQRV